MLLKAEFPGGRATPREPQVGWAADRRECRPSTACNPTCSGSYLGRRATRWDGSTPSSSRSVRQHWW